MVASVPKLFVPRSHTRIIAHISNFLTNSTTSKYQGNSHRNPKMNPIDSAMRIGYHEYMKSSPGKCVGNMMINAYNRQTSTEFQCRNLNSSPL